MLDGKNVINSETSPLFLFKSYSPIIGARKKNYYNIHLHFYEYKINKTLNFIGAKTRYVYDIPLELGLNDTVRYSL